MIKIFKNMKTKTPTSFIFLLAAPVSSNAAVSNSSLSYLIGGIIALLIMGYLVYTLLRPEKF
jgi:K+-transporting ATPase KdpF subunit